VQLECHENGHVMTWRSTLSLLPRFFLLGMGIGRPVDRFFESQGVRLAYSVQGQGEPVLLIHGFSSNRRMNWELPGISQALARDYQVIALDNRGHGQSDKPHDPRQYGNDMHALAAVVRGYHELTVQDTDWPASPVPSLALLGAEDAFNVKGLEELRRHLPTLEVVQIPGADHMSAFFRPVFLRTLQAFLGRLGMGRRNQPIAMK
jgi:pimeloyl-ACP methyl ester carboxylesterase